MQPAISKLSRFIKSASNCTKFRLYYTLWKLTLGVWTEYSSIADLMKRESLKMQYLNPLPSTFSGVDRVAQLVERRTSIPNVVGSNSAVVKQLFCFRGMPLRSLGEQPLSSLITRVTISTTYVYIHIYKYKTFFSVWSVQIFYISKKILSGNCKF